MQEEISFSRNIFCRFPEGCSAVRSCPGAVTWSLLSHRLGRTPFPSSRVLTKASSTTLGPLLVRTGGREFSSSPSMSSNASALPNRTPAEGQFRSPENARLRPRTPGPSASPCAKTCQHRFPARAFAPTAPRSFSSLCNARRSVHGSWQNTNLAGGPALPRKAQQPGFVAEEGRETCPPRTGKERIISP